jgi:hypothetical protein
MHEEAIVEGITQYHPLIIIAGVVFGVVTILPGGASGRDTGWTDQPGQPVGVVEQGDV